MEAIRCKECGDVRWSIRGFGDIEGIRCELCGGEMTPERRRPHARRFTGAATERRAGDFAARPERARRPTVTAR